MKKTTNMNTQTPDPRSKKTRRLNALDYVAEAGLYIGVVGIGGSKVCDAVNKQIATTFGIGPTGLVLTAVSNIGFAAVGLASAYAADCRLAERRAKREAADYRVDDCVRVTRVGNHVEYEPTGYGECVLRATAKAMELKPFIKSRHFGIKWRADYLSLLWHEANLK